MLAGFAEVSARAASVHGSIRPLLGFAAFLVMSDSWHVGGGGLVLSGGTELKTDGPLSGSQLHMGYGGVVVERTLRALSVAPLTNPTSLTGRILFGMGNASVRDRVTRVRFLSDNFFVIEPTLVLAAPLHNWVRAAALAGYRIALGVEDLGKVDGADLRGWSIGVALQLGPL